MVVYTLEQRWEILRPYFENHANVAERKIIFSDEAHFDLGGYVNKQNCSIWGTENLHAYIEKPTHPKRVKFLCGFWSRRIIGPIFFENEQAEVVTVNGDRYRAMLNKFLFTKIEEEDNYFFTISKNVFEDFDDFLSNIWWFDALFIWQLWVKVIGQIFKNHKTEIHKIRTN